MVLRDLLFLVMKIENESIERELGYSHLKPHSRDLFLYQNNYLIKITQCDVHRCNYIALKYVPTMFDVFFLFYFFYFIYL